MTILAYQTLYESSIAYGMRKAMQAEQSKAEKLNKLASMQQIIYEQDEMISQLKQCILDKLEEEQQDKIESEKEHEEKRLAIFEVNQAVCLDVRNMLLKLSSSN